MEPALLVAVRESLHKACGLVKPPRAALETFAGNLIKLLSRQQSETLAKTYLSAMLPDTCFAPHQEEAPGNSSPVCYAQVPGLREGFEEAGIPEPPANRITANPGLREALHAVLYSVSQMLGAALAKPPTDAALEKQTAVLVCQLYELSPEEMAAFRQS